MISQDRVSDSPNAQARGDAAPAAPTDRAVGAGFLGVDHGAGEMTALTIYFPPAMTVLLTTIAAHDRHATLGACVTDLIGRRARDIGLESLFRAAKERAPP